MHWQTVIGLEVHAQLNTRSKLFSNAPTRVGAPANSQTHFIDAGLPGMLPVLNQQAVHMAIQFGLAIDAEINDLSYFERKHYVYPDLPKGYQTSQLQRPIVSNGHLNAVTIERAHLEEDAGKSLHDAFPTFTGIDLNRAGIPLLEIVTTPCLFSAEEAIGYLKALHQLLIFLDICDGNMQDGSFRCDVNLSLRPKNSETLGTRTELKNLNSFRFIEKAIAYEQCRHQDLLERGQPVIQQTRLYCSDTNTTRPMRDKENENDYRYFPDPDLLPIKITAEDIARIKATLPALPAALRVQLIEQDGLPEENVDFLLSSPSVFRFYDAVKHQSHAPVKIVVNWLKGTYTAALHEKGMNFDSPPVSPERMACLLDRITDNLISANNAKRVFAELIMSDNDVDTIIESLGCQQVDNTTFIEQLIHLTVANNPQQAADYRAGKEKLMAFFVGQVMKQAKGCADPAVVNRLLRSYFDGH
ncbi:MAG TPA: Asp-tRNA(Asn)/Glu-tRNA(Gln) amidotransferase GatCAB subunit B [Legionella sp.]|nr:Asp-tRNA(Asn)/Glu-tRNA(Gln) amidotransferase GatCAB subunit B [Legionella sp.]